MRRFVQEAKAASALSHPNVRTFTKSAKPTARTSSQWSTSRDRRLMPNSRAALWRQRKSSTLRRKSLTLWMKRTPKESLTGTLSPRTIMITARSQAKVLDFGLAKVAAHRAAPISDREAGGCFSRDAPGDQHAFHTRAAELRFISRWAAHCLCRVGRRAAAVVVAVARSDRRASFAGDRNCRIS